MTTTTTAGRASRRVMLTAEHGSVKLGDQIIPGVYQGMSVSGEIRIKEEEAPGKSGKYKQALGWEDCAISLTLKLPNDYESTPYEKLKKLVALFRKADKGAKPEVYQITNPVIDAWGIKKVVFKSLRVDDPPDVDYIRGTLEFEEWESPMVQIEARAVKGPLQDRTVSLPTVEPNSSEVEEWQKRPKTPDYQDTIEVPDDD